MPSISVNILMDFSLLEVLPFWPPIYGILFGVFKFFHKFLYSVGSTRSLFNFWGSQGYLGKWNRNWRRLRNIILLVLCDSSYWFFVSLRIVSESYVIKRTMETIIFRWTTVSIYKFQVFKAVIMFNVSENLVTDNTTLAKFHISNSFLRFLGISKIYPIPRPFNVLIFSILNILINIIIIGI